MENKKWSMPTEFPDLSSAKLIAVDIETRDPDLKQKGPGVRRGGYIVGIGIVTGDKQFRGYYPIAHDEGSNLNKKAVFEWLKEELGRVDQPKIGANLLYDFDYLTEAGIPIGGDKWIDVQNAEALIDENARKYNLDSLARKYTKRVKLTGILEKECKERGLKGKAAQHIWQLPASVVGPYCIEDAELCIDIFVKQRKILLKEELYELFKMESNLMPVLLHMRRTGVRVDVKKLDKVIRKFKKRLRDRHKELNELAGFEVQIWAAASVVQAFDDLGLKYPITPRTRKPSLVKSFLANHEHRLPQLISTCRTIDKFITTFLTGSMRNQIIDGRIHALFNQLRGDEFGTVSGRFSSSHPNLQNIPVKDPELGPLCRSMFLPEEGCLWGRADYSQIEFRIFAHYAMGTGADDFRQRYSEDIDIDYHQWCADMAGVTRKFAKQINFGLIYGMGIKLLSEKLELPQKDAKLFLDEYLSKLPFIRTTQRKATSIAENRGYVRTILNRRRRFPYWEPSDRKLKNLIDKTTNKEVLKQRILESIRRGEGDNAGIQRATAYKALNAIVQGSAADMIKKAMVDCWKAGVFDVLTPHLTIHDELDVSIPDTKKGHRAFEEMLVIMRDTVPLKVPVKVDASIGKVWGEGDDYSQYVKKSTRKKK